MRQIAVLVEGPTEEAIVRDVLVPAALRRAVRLVPIIVITSATPTGARRGGGHWRHYNKQLRALLRGSHWHRVGLLIDYYQYPKGAPGRDAECRNHGEHQRAITEALRAAHPDPRFRPLVVLHEIESLVLAAIDAGQGDEVIPDHALADLRRAITRAGGPEKVNNGPSTSPSKRLARASRHYDKVMTGPGLIADAGLSAILERCPVFAAWWEDLLA